eukprot:361792-Prorocentrum_minimum.AAC.1
MGGRSGGPPGCERTSPTSRGPRWAAPAGTRSPQSGTGRGVRTCARACVNGTDMCQWQALMKPLYHGIIQFSLQLFV